VRLVLTLAGLALGILTGAPEAILRTFLTTFSNEKFVVPICSAMGFAYVLRQTGCDQHLVHLLVRPLERVRFLLIPGTVVVGFLVNIPVISQTSTAVAIGSVLVPLLRASRVSPVTTGAALLLGSSIGGELLNPGAPELNTVANVLNIKPAECVEHVLPLVLIDLALAVAVFWFLSVRVEAHQRKQEETRLPDELAVPDEEFRVNVVKALVPLVPVTLLFLTGPPLNWIRVPESWLVESKGAFESRLIGAAMLVGVVLAALTSGHTSLRCAHAFFEGAGYAFARIIGIIVAASCFGEGVRLLGVATLLGQVTNEWPGLLLPTAGALPLAMGWLCGSGMATTQSLFSFFVEPARAASIDPAMVGAIVSIAAAAGRTLSPVSAVTLMAAEMTETRPLDLVRRIAWPLVIGVTGVVIAASFMKS
jgi:DcuC family C4-dicarboxylate transporter